MSVHQIIHATFSLERIYPVPPERVFNAWADPEVKVRWFAGSSEQHELNFNPGGVERLLATHDGKLIRWESLYREIVADSRIVYTSVLFEQDALATASLTTVEFISHDGGTRLVLVEAAAYLEGREEPAWREQGTSNWLDALGTELTNQTRG